MVFRWFAHPVINLIEEVYAMAIMRVWIEAGCIGCGMSELNCPEVFKIQDETGESSVIEGVDFSLYEKQIKEAAEACPVEVIQFEES